MRSRPPARPPGHSPRVAPGSAACRANIPGAGRLSISSRRVRGSSRLGGVAIEPEGRPASRPIRLAASCRDLLQDTRRVCRSARRRVDRIPRALGASPSHFAASGVTPFRTLAGRASRLGGVAIEPLRRQTSSARCWTRYLRAAPPVSRGDGRSLLARRAASRRWVGTHRAQGASASRRGRRGPR